MPQTLNSEEINAPNTLKSSKRLTTYSRRGPVGQFLSLPTKKATAYWRWALLSAIFCIELRGILKHTTLMESPNLRIAKLGPCHYKLRDEFYI